MTIAKGMRLLSRPEVEETYGIPKRYLEVAVTKGQGPRHVRIGRLVRYRACDVEEWITANLSPEGS